MEVRQRSVAGLRANRKTGTIPQGPSVAQQVWFSGVNRPFFLMKLFSKSSSSSGYVGACSTSAWGECKRRLPLEGLGGKLSSPG